MGIFMGLEESVDCDGTCSSLDFPGARFLAHKEIERQFEKTLKSAGRSLFYDNLKSKIEDKFPRLYRILKYFG